MLKGICSLTLQATQRLLDSLLELMNVLPCAHTMKVTNQQPTKGYHRLGYLLDWPEGVWKG